MIPALSRGSGPYLDGSLGESLSPPAMAPPPSPTAGSHLVWEADALVRVKDKVTGQGLGVLG